MSGTVQQGKIYTSEMAEAKTAQYLGFGDDLEKKWNHQRKDGQPHFRRCGSQQSLFFQRLHSARNLIQQVCIPLPADLQVFIAQRRQKKVNLPSG